MKFLRRTLWLPWVMGFLIGACLGSLVLLYDPRTCGEAWGYTMGFVFCSTCVVYLVASVRAFWYTKRGGRPARRMLWLFPLIFAVTLGPTVVCKALDVDTVYSGPFSSLNGLFDILFYSCLSNISPVRQLFDGSPSEANSNIFVGWVGPDSLHAGFDVWRPETVLVDAVQSDALRRSERETAQLEPAQL